jgi:hypothetical protein
MSIMNKSVESTPRMKMLWWYWPVLILGSLIFVSVIVFSIAL